MVGPNTPQIADDIVEALRGRMSPRGAAAVGGIEEDTLYDLWKRGRRVRDGRLPNGAKPTKRDRYLADFSQRCQQAIAEAEAATIGGIVDGGMKPRIETRTTRKCAGLDPEGKPVWVEEVTTIEKPPDTRNLQWIAERRWWKEWSAHNRQVVTGADGGPVQHTHEVEITAANVLEKVHEIRRDSIPTTASDPEQETA